MKQKPFLNKKHKAKTKALKIMFVEKIYLVLVILHMHEIKKKNV